MPENDSRDRERRRGSLLTLANTAPRSEAASEPPRADSASERHRMARSRREAAPSPLVAALARSAPRQAPDPFAESDRELEAIFAEDREAAARASGPERATERPAPREEPAREGEAPEPSEPARGRMAAAPLTQRSTAAEPAASRPRAAEPDETFWRPLIDPMAVIGGVIRSRGIILATTVCGAAIGAMIAMATPKLYVAGAELLVDPRDIRVAERELTAGGLSSDATLAVVENQVRVIMSGSVMNKVVDRLGLDRDPEFNGEGGSGLGSQIGRLRALLAGGGSGDGANKRSVLAVENLYRAVDAERGGRTFVISVRAKTESPDKSALIVNTLMDVFLETYGSIQAGAAGRASDELSSRLSELRNNLEEAERRIEAYKSENDLIDAQGRLITDDEMVKLNDQLGAARARTLELDARAASAREVTVEAALAGNLPEQISSPVLTDMRSQYAVLAREAERASTRLGPRHPERLALDAQLNSARQQIQQELRLVASSLQVELRRAVQLEQDLAARLAQMKARQANISEELVTLRELERDANAKRAVYEAFLLRARETGEQRDLNTANMAVISPATPPLLPSGMSRTMKTLVSAFLGFGAGVGIGALRGAWNGFQRGPAPAAPAPVGAATAPRRRREAEPDDHEPAAPAAPDTRNEAPVPETATSAQAADTAEEASMHHSPLHPNWPIRASLADGPEQHPYAQQRQPQPHPQWPTGGYHPQAYPQAQMQPSPYPQAPVYAQAPAYPQAYAAGPAPQGHSPYPPHYQPHSGQPVPSYAAPYPVQGYADPYRAPDMASLYGHQPQPAPYQGQGWPAEAPWAPAAPQQQAWSQPAQPEPQRHEAPKTAARPDADSSAIDEIRESLREFREALRELAESRTRRRFL